MFRTLGAAAIAALGLATAVQAAGPPPAFPGQAAFRDLYRQLVEIDTTAGHGSCTAAAEAMARRLRDAGYPAADVRVLVPGGRPRDGNLAAVLRGTDPKASAVLLLAHLDVVEARREDWSRDPFKLVEANGFFYGRGVSDDKAMAAAFVDALIRYRQENFRPRRTIKLALTCGEETPDLFDGVAWLLATHPGALHAGMALNEGAGGRLEGDRRIYLAIQAGEKVYQDFVVSGTSPGGHSSRPTRDNVIYRLAAALGRLAAYDFPIHLDEATVTHFARMDAILGGAQGAAMRAMLDDPPSPDAVAMLSADPGYNAMMRTTCVVTTIAGGGASNALPERAEANINCRILPEESVARTEQTLVRVLADPNLEVSLGGKLSPVSPAPPLTPRILRPAETVAQQLWPGVPLVPTMSTGATDGRFLLAAGIPTYGLSGMFGEPDGGGVHGADEHIRVRSVYEGREFLYRVVKLYADQRE